MEPSRLALVTGLLVCALLATAHSLPPRRSRADSADSFVAVGTNEIATSVLQSYVDVDANIAFSPLGVSALLAILAEGARGETRNQLVTALHLPADREETRAVYKAVLTRLKEKHSLNHPEFRNWFYVYKNYTVEQCFRDVLEENYLTEVRDVDSPHSPSGQSTTTNEVASTEDVVVHKPIKFTHTGTKVELPVISSEGEEQPELPSEGEEPPRPVKVEMPATPSEGEEPPRPVKVEMTEGAEPTHPVKGEGLDANNLPADLDPISQVPIDPSSLDKPASSGLDNVHVTKTSQEDSIRTIMVQEAVMMQEALKVNKTEAFIRQREQEIKEALEKDVVNKEQIKVAVEDQIQTEKEIESAIADKIEKQEAIKEALENDVVHKEQIKVAVEDQIQTEKEIESAIVDKVEKQEAIKAALETDMVREEEAIAALSPAAGMIQVAVVVMNDEEVKRDKEQHVDFDREDENEAPLPPFTDVSVFDNVRKEEEKDNKIPPFVNVSIFDHPASPHNKRNHTATEEKAPIKADEVTEEPPKKEPEEAMMALEREVRSAEEVTSSFSGNNLVSKTSDKVTSMMIAFNALFFKGSWKTPFVTQTADGPHSFYTSDTDKIDVPMMHSEGSFNIGKISALDSVAIDLPYEGGRYSLLVVLPNSRTGLRKLTADLSGYSLCDLSKTLTSQHVEVCLPSFEVQTTTKPIRALDKFGVSHVFSKENADLSGITPVNGLYVQDMSQLVTLNVELTSSSTNFLTASSEAASTRRGGGDKFIADRPFLYFVHDVIDNIIIVAGKVTNPTLPADPKAEEL